MNNLVPNKNNNNQGNKIVQNNKNKDIAVLMKNLAVLESEEAPDWENIVKLQKEIIRRLGNSLQDQKNEIKNIQNRVSKITNRLNGQSIPYQDMEKLANILKPFLAKTYNANKSILTENKA